MSSWQPPEADYEKTPIFGQEGEEVEDVDESGHQSRTWSEHLGRAIAAVVFVCVLPFVVVALGTSRARAQTTRAPPFSLAHAAGRRYRVASLAEGRIAR